MQGSFATTHWSVILGAADEQNRRSALELLYKAYWEPVCVYLRRRGVEESEIEDVAQDFFLHFFDRALNRADPSRGRFRSFLLGALDRHFLQLRRHDRAQKRGGQCVHIPLNAAVEEIEGGQSLPDLTPEFDAAWAKALFAQSLRRFDTEGRALCGKLSSAEVRAIVFDFGSNVPRSLVKQCGPTPTAAKSRIFRLRRRFREILREEVARTVTDEADVESELAHLCKVLGASWE
jgi:RNA polymerase sigma-70 factor (ECF subfamily)